MRISAILGALLLAAQSAHACQCGEPQPVSRAFGEAGLVAVGTVTRIEDQWSVWKRFMERLGFGHSSTGDPAEDAVYYGQRVTLRLERRFKAPTARDAIIFTGRGGGDCGIPFKVGVSYLIYGRAIRSGAFYSGICHRTSPVDRAREDLLALERLHTTERERSGTPPNS